MFSMEDMKKLLAWTLTVIISILTYLYIATRSDIAQMKQEQTAIRLLLTDFIARQEARNQNVQENIQANQESIKTNQKLLLELWGKKNPTD